MVTRRKVAGRPQQVDGGRSPPAVALLLGLSLAVPIAAQEAPPLADRPTEPIVIAEARGTGATDIKAGQTYPDPLDLAAAHVEAIGGRAAVEAVRGYHARGTAEIAAQGVRGTVEEWIRPGEAWHERWEIDGFGRIALGFDRRLAWTSRPDQPPSAVRDEKIREGFASRVVLHPETDLTAHLGTARTIGRREIDGRSTWEVRVTTPAGGVQSRFYDEETGLLRAAEREELLTGEQTPILQVYEDWRPIDGVLFPHRLTRTGENLPGLVTVLESVTTEPVPPEAFRPPAEDVVEVERNVMVPMRDGVRLATDIYRPRGAGERLPVILIRLPYDKAEYAAATGPARFFAERGYVVVVQNSRGKWGSEGEYVLSQSARNDGYDTVEWAASQPWSNGRVGTYGCSYLGENQVMLAAERHPAHLAMIPQAAGGAVGTAGGRYGFFGFFEGGAFSLSAAAGWFPDAGTKDRTDGQVRIPLPEGLHHQPTIDMMRHHGVGPTDWEDVLARPLDDPWWQALGYIADSDRFATPALHVNSWYDLGAAETLQLFDLMQRNAVDDRTREHQYVIISPTTHCRSEQAGDKTRVGELDVGDARLPYWETYVRWFDHWLKGADNGVTSMPRVQYYVTGANEWRSADEWPVPEARSTRFHLRSGGAAGERMDDGVLSRRPPTATEPPDRYVYDPADPVPSRGGSMCCTENPQDQPGAYDQSDIEQRADVLVYTTPPLDDPLDVVGPLRATLYVSSSAPDTDFTVKLVDVHPDGRAFNVQEGIIRARYREGFNQTVWMRPGEVYEVEVDLHATAHRFLAGHRVRVEVSSSNFPRFDRNLNTGGDNFTETEWRIAENAIHHSAEHPSHLLLPVVAGGGEAPAMGWDTVHVASPTGVRERDRASILAAIERARPGGTVLFAPGTYLVGELIRLETPRLTLLGHPEGTVLRGCHPEEYEANEREALRTTDAATGWELLSRCGMLELIGGHVAVRNLTLEHSRLGLVLGCCEGEDVLRSAEGGYRIEANTFRNSGNSIRAILSSPEPTVIRGNRFINTFHALSGGVRHVHMLDNEISVPEPGKVPGAGHPGFAIGIRPPYAGPAGVQSGGVRACEHNIIAGNRIVGHTDGILLRALPGTSCRANTIRGNAIEVRRVPIPDDWVYADVRPLPAPGDSSFVGIPLALINIPARSGSAAEGGEEGRLEDNLVEGNRIVGADGLGIEVLGASRNRLVSNTITGVRRREPFPGNTTGGFQRWAEANGSGIWISPGSDGNEIVGNTFEDVAGAAVFLEGDDNRVELQSASDRVRDLGTGNDVVIRASAEHEIHVQSADLTRIINAAMRATGALPEDSAPVPAPTAAKAIEALDHADITYGLALSSAYFWGIPSLRSAPMLDSLGLDIGNERDRVRAENLYLAEQVARYPDRLVGACSVNPLTQYALEELELCAADSRITAFSLNLAPARVDFRDETHVARLRTFFEALARTDLAVIVHMRNRGEGYGAEDAGVFIREVLAAAPGVPVQIAHMAGWGPYDEGTDSAMQAFVDAFEDGTLDRDRVTFGVGVLLDDPEGLGDDTAAARRAAERNTRLAERMRQVGIERVAFSTDWPFFPPHGDPRTRIARNRTSLRNVLLLEPEELDRFFSNVGPVFRHLVESHSTEQDSRE